MAKKRDKQLDDYLAGKDSLSSLYSRAGLDEPSAEVDRAILDAARSSVEKKSSAGGPFTGNWFVPVSLAAVLVLAIGIVVTLEQETGPALMETDRYTPPEPVRDPKPEKKLPSKPVNPVTPRRQLAPPVESSTKPDSSTGLTANETPPEPVMGPPRLRRESGESSQAPAPGAATSPGPQAAPAEAGVLEPAPKPAMEDQAPVPDQQETEQVLQKLDADTADGTEEITPLTAEKWLDSVRLLIEQDKLDEARRQLADFQRAYPEYPLGAEFAPLRQ